ncbi:glycoside hydrolase family protein [Roseibium album]|uniref:glycoside hydrolase family protein n=1 Tax=Roseibium album TaxID=311410 RepID=UPI003BAF9CCE
MPKLSGEGAAFVAAHEGFVSKTYRCPAGVKTIGYGFTMGSKVFSAWWHKKHGRGLRMGDRISREDADMLLPKVFDEEYGAAVNAKIGTKVQHEYDGAGSTTFNCGPGALNWTWAKFLKARDVPAAAKRLRTTAVTANGRKLAGLVRRRKEEAALIEFGKYGHSNAIPASVSALSEEIRAYQKQLIALGYDLGEYGADGVDGKQTIEAVKKFQTDHGLVVDGIVGPASRAALIRAMDAKRGAQATSGGTLTVGGGAGAVEGAPETAAQTVDTLMNVAMWGVGALAVVGLIVLFIRYRGVITGQRVAT